MVFLCPRGTEVIWFPLFYRAVACIGDCRRGLNWYSDLLNTYLQIVTTCKDYAVSVVRTSQITMVHTRSSQTLRILMAYLTTAPELNSLLTTELKTPRSWYPQPIFFSFLFFNYSYRVSSLLMLGVVSDEVGSVVHSCCWISPTHAFPSPSPAGLMYIFYCHKFETCPSGRARFPYLFPPGTVQPSYIPRHWVVSCTLVIAVAAR